jgi:ribonuclease J
MIIEQLRVLPLGGLGEIGMNCMLLEWKNEVILIDCGIQFADPSYTGIELLAPDFSFLRKKLKKIKGVIVTHGHEDHIGAIPYLAREVPLNIYTTPFPRGLLAEKFTEFSKLKEVKFHGIKPREKFTVGSFTFDPIPVAHSIIESLAVSIETPVGTLIHTGDFKHDANELGEAKFDFKPFEQIGKKGVRLLMSDSTNAERTGHTLSERDITKSFEKILKEQNTRIIIGLFASNIRRVENLLKVAGKLGKKVALAGRSMHTYTKLAHEQLSLTIPVDTLVAIEDTHKYPDDQVVVLVTGSQAEPGSALMRMSQGTHNTFSIKPNDSIILSSRFIPGNERAITRMIDELYRLGADVMYESIHQIHVSGHGFQEELLMMLNATKPENFVPIHGEFRHLKKHSLLAKKAGVDGKKIFVIENGQSILIDGKP